MTALRGLDQFQNLQGGFGFAARPAYRWFERAQYPRCGQDRASMSRRSSGALGFKFAGLIVVLKYENIMLCRTPSNTSIRGYSLRSSRGPLTFLRITQGLQNVFMDYGPNLRLPHSRAFGGGLFELRPRGKSGIGRAFYCFLVGQRAVVLHAFIKKSQQTPERELTLARKRMREVLNG